jgi:hypothetical protein
MRRAKKSILKALVGHIIKPIWYVAFGVISKPTEARHKHWWWSEVGDNSEAEIEWNVLVQQIMCD